MRTAKRIWCSSALLNFEPKISRDLGIVIERFSVAARWKAATHRHRCAAMSNASNQLKNDQARTILITPPRQCETDEGSMTRPRTSRACCSGDVPHQSPPRTRQHPSRLSATCGLEPALNGPPLRQPQPPASSMISNNNRAFKQLKSQARSGQRFGPVAQAEKNGHISVLPHPKMPNPPFKIGG